MFAPSTDHLTLVDFRPPIFKTTEKVCKSAPEPLLATLRKEWDKLHTLICHGECMPLICPPTSLTVCHRAGRCFCGPRGRDVIALVRNIQQWVKAHICKGCSLQSAHDDGDLVVQLTSNIGSVWLHLSWLNKIRYDGSVMAMDEVDDGGIAEYAAARGLKPLRVDIDHPELGMNVLWNHCDDAMDLNFAWRARLWKIAHSPCEAEPKHPGLIFVNKADAIEKVVWDPDRDGRRRRGRAVGLGPGAIADVDGGDAEAEGDQEENQEDLLLPLLDGDAEEGELADGGASRGH